ncbi:sulfurtransferase [Microbacterium sp. A84]|uniref:sulfurtransferase n=1 Tax=Microbacterium sp. A84 TaxID=3450715 RepID=UPI003F42C7E3
MTHLVSVAQLLHLQRSAEHGAGPAVRLLDVRWRLDRPEGRPEYVRSHLPGAVYVDLEHELARRGQPEDGRHPLPESVDLERAARGWGLSDGDIVVGYDDNRSVPAARLWWLLRRSGIDARVLDGGIRAWVGEGLPVETGDVRPAAGNVSLHHDDDVSLNHDGVSLNHDSAFDVLEIEELGDFIEHGVLLDVRTPEQYNGTRTAGAPVAGHIPGAVNLPAMVAVASDGRLQHPDVLRRIFASAGVDADTAVGVYCSSGVAAMHSVLALEHAGIRARVYPGSWSQWSNTRGKPVAVGILPSGRLTTV